MADVRTAITIGLRVVGLGVLLWGLYAVDLTGACLVQDAQTAPLTLLLVSLLHAATLSYLILRSRWRGWRLVGAIALAFYGVSVGMVVIEAVYLQDALPPSLVIRTAANGALTVTLFSTSAVLVFGRMTGGKSSLAHRGHVTTSWIRWLWKLAVIGVGYAFLYVLFGACVFLPLACHLAPEALAAYAALELSAWVIPFQAVRGILWAALTLPVIRMAEGRRWEIGLAVSLLYAVLMGANLLRPAGLPAGLQAAHLVEVTGASFCFGWVVARSLYDGRMWRRTQREG
jgi:hypothetical protein